MVRRARAAPARAPEPIHDQQQLSGAILGVKAALRTLDASGQRLERATARTRTRLCTQFLGAHSAQRQQPRAAPSALQAGRAAAAAGRGNSIELLSYSDSLGDASLETCPDSEGGSSAGPAAREDRGCEGLSDASESDSEAEADAGAEARRWAAIGVGPAEPEARGGGRAGRSCPEPPALALAAAQPAGGGPAAAGGQRGGRGEEAPQQRPATPRFRLQVAPNRPFSAPQVRRAGGGDAAARRPRASAGLAAPAAAERPGRRPPSPFATPRRPGTARASPAAAPERLLLGFPCEPQFRCMTARGTWASAGQAPERRR